MSAHTPGPWVVAKEKTRWGDAMVVPVGADIKADGWLAAVGHSDNQAADARLIAAAPEMLEALRRALPRLVHGTACGKYRGTTCTCESRTTYDTISALLARVEGGGQ